MSGLAINPKDMFSRVVAHIVPVGGTNTILVFMYKLTLTISLIRAAANSVNDFPFMIAFTD